MLRYSFRRNAESKWDQFTVIQRPSIDGETFDNLTLVLHRIV